MRIGELAAVAGVTPRAVRHYHHLGLLPEPERRPNGYRTYDLRHAVLLARIRRLTELGLGLAEVRDVLADDAGRELVDVLTELDEDLARQERALGERRRRVAVILAEARAGRLRANGPLSPELTSLLGELDTVVRDAPPSPMAVKDRELLALLDTAATPQDSARLISALGETVQAPGGAARAHEVYALLDALAEAAPDDPRVDGAARALVAFLPPDVARAARAEGPQEWQGAFAEALFADFAPAQAAAVRRAIALLADTADTADPAETADATEGPQ
ncbi:MerR family transcriptional regulator [Streptomyces sp. NPDC049906]|uniref:MerR family transcriptional regulator n=1 Tax=Streptomyces sp. NPDC049906 TaxID=3155656 RepID=UPI003448F2A0